MEQLRGEVPGIEAVKAVHVPREAAKVRLWGAAPSGPVKEVVADSDLCHLHGVWSPLLLITAKACRALGVPYVVMPHGMLDRWSMSQKRIKKQLALRLGFSKMLRGASFLHMLNRHEVVGARPVVGGSVRCEIIPNGIFEEEIYPLPERGSFASERTELAGNRYVLFLSRLHFKKGLDYLVEAFSQVASKLPDVKLVIAGPDDGYEQQVQRLVDEAGLKDRVVFTGSVYGAAKYGVIRDAACFCLPSRQEGFSIAITEALACGCPVVISDACHFPEVAEANAGRVVDLSAQSTARALIEVLGDPARAELMGKNGQQLVRSQFTWPAIARQTLDLYDSVL